MKKDICYIILFYLATVGIAFLLAPLLTYLFLIIGAIFAGVGFILDVILCIVLWWAGFEGGIGEMIMDSVSVMSPTTAWLIFTAIATIIFGKILMDCWMANEHYEKKQYQCPINLNINVAKDFSPLVKDIFDSYRTGKMGKELANSYIKVRFEKWLREEHHITNRKDIEAYWKSKKWVVEIK